jgi:hypothetical protein
MLLQTIYNIASGGPQCQIVLDHERGETYKEEDDVRGVVIVQGGTE